MVFLLSNPIRFFMKSYRFFKATMGDMVKISIFEPVEKISVNLQVTVNTC